MARPYGSKYAGFNATAHGGSKYGGYNVPGGGSIYAGGGGWTPAALGSTVKLWLRGDLGITQSAGNITTWADQSGNHNDVTGSVPYIANGINNCPGASYSGVESLSNSTSSLVAATGPRTVYAVSKMTDLDLRSILTIRLSNQKADYTTPFSVAPLIYTDGVNGGNNATVSVPVTGNPEYVRYGSSGPGALMTYAVNGTERIVAQPSGASTETGTTGFSVGGGGVAIKGFYGVICEIVVCDSVIDAPTEAKMFAYLSARYGV